MSVGLAVETSATNLDSRVFLDRSRDALQQLAVLLRNSYLHDLGNQVFEEPLAKLEHVLGRLLQGEGEFRLERGGEEFFANGVRLRMEIRTLHAYKYVLSELQKRDIGGIEFGSKPTVKGSERAPRGGVAPPGCRCG